MKSLKFTPLNIIVFLSAVMLTVLFLLYQVIPVGASILQHQILPVVVYMLQPIFAGVVWGYLIFYMNLP